MPGSEYPKLGTFSTLSIGIGGMVGGGIFAVTGLTVEMTRGGAPIAFLIAGIVAFICFGKQSDGGVMWCSHEHQMRGLAMPRWLSNAVPHGYRNYQAEYGRPLHWLRGKACIVGKDPCRRQQIGAADSSLILDRRMCPVSNHANDHARANRVRARLRRGLHARVDLCCSSVFDSNGMTGSSAAVPLPGVTAYQQEVQQV